MDFRRWFADFVKTIATTFVKSFSKWEALFYASQEEFVLFSARLIATKTLPYLLQRVYCTEFEKFVK